MSGHSHAKTIMHKKQIADAKRGQIFSKLSRLISLAARDGGPDPKMNPKLRLAIEQAKTFAMPKENIERAIKRGIGKIEGEKYEEVLFEAYGPGGVALIIEGITDNKNRTFNEVRQILNQNGGKLVGEGAVKWMFERKGCLVLDLKSQTEDLQDREKLETISIEAGAEDLYWHNGVLDVYTKIGELEEVKKNLEEKNIKIESFSLDWVPKEEITVDEKTKEACQKLFELLYENEAVQEIYSNIKIP
jgi:YebC/PmpR family DNA-binding regulatory protein